ncbi:hypothetical protein B0O79_0595 [Flavobacteriaceae bacterium MAR_2009_75]|nr:hypothetical protein B0O79_0595 [Flavobacteriaceae bacterium MAR_2009_75]
MLLTMIVENVVVNRNYGANRGERDIYPTEI